MYDSMFLIGIGKKKACFLPCLQSDWFSDAYASRGALAGAPLYAYVIYLQMVRDGEGAQFDSLWRRLIS